MQPMLVVPPPLHAERYFQWITQSLDGEAILRFIGDVHHIYRWQERYAWATVQTARQMACPVLSLREAFLDSMCFERLFCLDGIHPSAEGHGVMLGCLRAGCLGE